MMTTIEMIAHKMRRLTDINKADVFVIYVDKKIFHIDKPVTYKSEKDARKAIDKYFDGLPVGYKADIDKLFEDKVVQILPVVNQFDKEEAE